MATKEPIEVEGTLEEFETEGVPVPDTTAIAVIDRALIDMQIATAKQYPRVIKAAFTRAMTLATQDEETAGSMFYVLPRKNKDGKRVYIEGPSVRAAELLAHVWGNLRINKRVINITDTHVVAQGICWDLENNVAISADCQRRITNSAGRRYNDDMITTTSNAAASIGLRNAVFSVIPKSLWNKIYEAAKKKANGEGTPIETRRQNALNKFARYGRQEADVLALLQVDSANAITEEHLQKLVGIWNSISEGSATIEDVFADVDAADGEGGKSTTTQQINERIKNAGQTPPEKKPMNPPEQKPAAPPEKKDDKKPTPEQQEAYGAAMEKALNDGNYKGGGRRAALVEWEKEHIGKLSVDWTASDFDRAVQMLESGILP